ncbi:hypothetical protein D3C76_1241140 [compost metagenome]
MATRVGDFQAVCANGPVQIGPHIAFSTQPLWYNNHRQILTHANGHLAVIRSPFSHAFKIYALDMFALQRSIGIQHKADALGLAWLQTSYWLGHNQARSGIVR